MKRFISSIRSIKPDEIKFVLNAAKESIGTYSSTHKLPDPRQPGVVPEMLGPFDLVGENWYSSEDLPVAILWGFAPWKRPHIQHYFPQHKLLFVRGARLYLNLEKFIQYIPKNKSICFVGWGLKLPSYAVRYAKKRSIPVHYVEDGFLRSFHPGALHVKPWSLAIDSQAPYYATRAKTDLQDLLQRRQLEGVEAEKRQAGEAGIALMRAACLTKYFSLRIGNEDWTPPPTQGRNIILVIGQVEDDAAILQGYSRGFVNRRFSNLRVVQKAIEDHKDACILYRPHPDTYYNGRKSRHEKKIARLCTVIEPTAPLQAVFPHVSHIYAGTSLAAFEAALWGVPVTTLGLPFYAGSPEIRHLQGPKLGFSRLSLPELFSVIYLDYPRYIHPVSDKETSFFDLASYFIVEKFKHLVLEGVPENTIDLEALKANKAHLSPPAILFLYLLDLGRTGLEAPEEVVALAGDPLRYEDIPQFSELLIKACRFDTLALYLGKIIAQFEQDLEALKDSKTLMTQVMETVIDNQKVLRGRIAITLPDLSEWISPPTFSGYVIPDNLLLAYARALANNLQYDILERVVSNIEFFCKTESLPHGATFLRGFAALLVEKPARSERNPGKRAQLLDRIGRLYHTRLLAELGENPLLVRALADMAMDRPHSCQASCIELLERLAEGPNQDTSYLLADYKKHMPHVIRLVRYLANQSQHDLVDRLMSYLDESDDRVRMQWLRLHVERREIDTFYRKYSSLPEDLKTRYEVKDLLIRAQKEEGEFLSALETVRENLSLTTLSRRKRSILYDLKEKLEFSLEASRILNSVPQPQVPKGVVFLGTLTDYKSVAMIAPVLPELRKRGYAIVSLVNGMLSQSPTGLPNVDQFMGAISTSVVTRKNEHHNEWLINWKQKIVSSGDVNYYQGIYESLANFFRVFDVDINQDAIRRNFFYRLSRMDDCLDICNRIFKDVVKSGLPSIILSSDGHVAPFSIFRDFCLSKSHPNLSYVNVNIGYENYFTNLGGRFSTTTTISDMTLCPTHRAPFLARADRFERWYSEEKDNPIYRSRADELINFNRVHQEGDAASHALIADLKEARDQGRKVVACLGKIPIDLGVPYDGGPAHEDMRDWLNHTIETVRGREDILLLIKPHPHELQPSIALDLVDGFFDLIRVPLPKNVRLLGHREINNHQLAPHLDLALLWNGSSALELSALGVPVMMNAYFGRHDYPVDLLYPRDREHYAAFIEGKSWPRPDEETRRKAACLIAYMETSDVNFFNDYAWRPVTNDSVGVPSFRADRIAQFMLEGDPEMARAADRILERFGGEAS